MKYFFAASFNILLYLSTLVGYGQDNGIDSLKKVLQSQKEDTNKVNTLNLLSANYWNTGDHEDARATASDAITLSQKINFPRGEVNGYVNIGYSSLVQADYTTAITSLNKGLNIADSLHLKDRLLRVTYALGRVYERSGNYPAALKYQYQSLKLAKETNHIPFIFDALGAIGFIYIDQNNLPEAEKNFQEGLKIAIQSSDSTAIAFASKNLADVYLKQGDTKNSLTRLLSALKIFESQNMESHAAWTYYSLGLCYLKIAESEEPIKANADLNISHSYFEQSKQLYIKLKDKTSIAECYADIGNILMKLNKPGDARRSLQTSLVLSTESKSQENLKKTYQLLAGLDSVEGNYKQAYEHYKLFSLYKDSLSNEESAKKAMQEKLQYEFDEKAARVKIEQDKKDAEAIRKRSQQYYAIAGLALVVLTIGTIAFIQFRNNKHKQKANALLQQQKEEIVQQRDKVENTLSDLKSTQSQLIQSEKMASLGQLTAGIAHEIQNPLNFVNNFSDVNAELIEDLKAEAISGNTAEVIAIANDLKSNEEKINHHGKRADAIVKGMLEHSRQGTGQKQITDVNSLADEYLKLAYQSMLAKDKNFNVIMKTEFDNSIDKINIVPQDIGRVLLNLYNNSFYAASLSASGGFSKSESGKIPTVWVSTKKEAGKVLITVKDNGPGIPQNIIDKIFQPFFTTKPTGQGTGLGLSLAYDIVKAHGGEIKIDTGDGATFTIQLPVS